MKPDNLVIKIEEGKVETMLVDFNIAKKAKSRVDDYEETKGSSKFKCNYLTHIATPGS